jgi:hypothetical protein
MKKIQINAAAIVRDVRQRMDLKALMEKHDLSYPNLLKVKNILLERGLVSRVEIGYLNLADHIQERSISAKEFLASFRERPDDLYLMKKYKLKVKDLQGIYDTLMLAGLLSEYEYHSRDGKVRELEETTDAVCETSTEVTLLRNHLDTGFAVSERRCSATPRKTYPDLGRTPSAVTPDSKSKGNAPVDQGTVEEGISRACPNCGLSPHPSSPDACVYCGVVYSKAKRDSKYEGIGLWEADYRDRSL